ncbi:RNA-binding protein Cwf29 [Vermiconidia calcicola]|uniref:RNA-binding protein Cwf29 n=1 Tax=Vermiconidia calcicola TaxID=1690605 RepID=A0ACC3NXB0_9PEZI|nr:RNA-binding protein Cwf29 [Vermiconidia calcicola]
MQSIRQISRLNETELTAVTPSNASWHTDYRDTAYVHIGGLPFELSEGDILTIFSQYGNPTHINLVRDKETGKSRGFAFLKYEDQRSCDLAVDNLSGAGVLGRVLGVDHARYLLKEGERETVGDDEVEEEEEEVGDDEGEGGGRRKRRKTESESEEERPMVKEEMELAKLMREHDADDPMKAYLIEQKKAEVEEALKAVTLSKKSSKGDEREGKHRHRHKHSHRSRREASEEENDDGREDRRSSRRRREEDGHSKSRSHKSSRKERTATPPDSDDERDRRTRNDADSENEHRRSRHGEPHDRSRSRERHRRR